MNKRSKIILTVVALIILAVFVGWLIGRSNKPAGNTASNSASSGTSSSAANTSVSSLVSYTLPDGWTQSGCSASNNNVYIIPAGASLNCSADPSAPIKIYVDSQDITDCSQLTPASNQGIKKHVCISLYIDGHKSLKASTEYSSNSSYKTDTTVADYFVNTGNGVVAVEYTYTSSNDYQIGYDQLATSVHIKT